MVPYNCTVIVNMGLSVRDLIPQDFDLISSWIERINMGLSGRDRVYISLAS
jgi:hypothetical protein